MKKTICIIVTFYYLILCPDVRGKELSVEKIIDNVRKIVDKAELISAEFDQTFVWSVAEERQKYSGRITIGKDNAFRIETAEQLIVSDGKFVWTFDRINQQVLIDHLDESEGAFLPRQFLFRFQKDYSKTLLKMENVDGQNCYHLVLVPKNQDVYIQKLDVWVNKDDWLTRKISYLDVNENVTIYLINKITLHQTYDNSWFQFNAPAGVEVIDMR